MTCEICGEGPCHFPTFCTGVNASYTTQDPAKPAGLNFLDTAEWDTPPPAQEWTVQDRFPRREVVNFSGEGGAGKSTIALHLCCAHAVGKDWMHTLPEPGAAIFVDAEDDEKVIWRRTYAIAQHQGVTVKQLVDGGLKIVSLHGKDAVLAAPMKNGTIKPTALYRDLVSAAEMFSPQCIVLASSANIFAGNEIDRSQVTQFIGLLNHLAIRANGTVILISHPSVEGMKSDSGISGSTQWHNAVRARMYLKAAKVNGGDEPNPDLKQLEFRKNQYGPSAASITLKWRAGLFLPETGPSSFDKAIRESQADHAFSVALNRSEREGFIVSATPKANNYAPKVFCQQQEALQHNLSKDELAAAMQRAMAAGAARIASYGRPSNPHTKLTGRPA